MVNRRKYVAFGIGLVALGCGSFAACSLTNLDEYTSGGGDSGGDTGSGDGGKDATLDTADSSGKDSALDTLDSTVDDSAADVADSRPDASLDALDSAVDSTVDTADATVVDTADVGSDVGDAPDTFDVLALGDVGDASCPITALGLSEVMVRPVSGSGDAHEWLELTNYGSCDIDIGGITVKVVSSSIEKGTFTFPDATTVAPGASVVVADNDLILKADVIPGYTLGTVFSFGKPGDVFVNGGNITVSLYARGAGTAFEAAFIPSRGSSWSGLGRSYGYPVPSTACPASARLGAGGTLSSTWKDAPILPSSQYGDAGVDAVGFYGSPTKPNTDIACP